jgi:hypothetical protein
MTLVVTPKGNINGFLDQFFAITILQCDDIDNGSVMFEVTESNFGKVKKQLEKTIAQTSYECTISIKRKVELINL